MQRKFTQLLRLLLIIFAFGITQNANAQVRDGEAVVKIGETTTVYLGATYQRTLSKATGVSFDWYNYDNSIIITRETKNYAEIKGKKATTSGKLYFTCSYNLDGFRLSMSLFYDIEVRNNIVYVTKVEVTPSSATMIVGERLQLNEKIYPINATNQTVTWYSSEPNVASVGVYTGFVEASSPGSTRITCNATDGSGEYATCDITVIPAEPTAVNITTEETSISVGETLKLGYAITPAGVTSEVEWESDNTAVATVNDEGVITAIGVGEANIIITTANGLTDSYHITVTAATSGGIPVNGKFEVDGIYYEVIDSVAKAVAVTFKGDSYTENEYSDTINIPASITYLGITYSITSIGDNAFSGCSNLTAVYIPNSVASIEDYAFEYCSNLSTISIPNSVTKIGYAAFYKCVGLKSFIIPTSITEISGSMLYECSGLTSVIIPNSVTKIGSHAFCSCISLISINIPNSVTEIGGCAFYGCTGLTSVDLPNSITQIGYSAFYGCIGLNSIIIPKSVIEIGPGVFSGCTDLISITVDENNTIYDSRDNCNAIIETSTNTFIQGCKASFIPSSVTNIYKWAFRNCYELASITIPDSVTKIGESSFSFCTNLTTIYIPNSVTVIEGFAFEGCSALTEVTIPSSITEIRLQTFNFCSNLTSITIPNSVIKIENNAFGFCSNLTNISIPTSVTAIGCYAFHHSGWYNLQSDGVLYLNNCCLGYKGLPPTDSLTILDGTRLIGNYSFQDCKNLKFVTIPNSVVSIGELAFEHCFELKEVTSLNPIPPECGGYCFEDVPTTCVLKVPAGSKELYAEAEGWSQFINIVEIASVGVSTQENNATFAIPTTEGAATYTVNVYSDEAMTQLVATTDYYEPGRIVPMSTSLELSIDGFDIGTYYYDVIVKSETGETLGNYTGTFEIETNGVEEITQGNNATEVARYDIHGRPLAKPTKGVNIVVFSDGTTRKEVVR